MQPNFHHRTSPLNESIISQLVVAAKSASSTNATSCPLFCFKYEEKVRHTYYRQAWLAFLIWPRHMKPHWRNHVGSNQVPCRMRSMKDGYFSEAALIANVPWSFGSHCKMSLGPLGAWLSHNDEAPEWLGRWFLSSSFIMTGSSRHNCLWLLELLQKN